MRAEGVGTVTRREASTDRRRSRRVRRGGCGPEDEAQRGESEDSVEDDGLVEFDDERCRRSLPSCTRADAPEEIAEEARPEVSTPSQRVRRNGTKRRRHQVTATEQKTAAKIARPAPTFDKKPQLPGSVSNRDQRHAWSAGLRGRCCVSSSARYSSGDAGTALFPRPHIPTETKPADDGWKSFRVQLQSGWFLAVLVLLLATISFVAGMAVRRGALNAVMGDIDDVAQPKSAPAPSVAPNPSNNNSGCHRSGKAAGN